MHKPGKKAGRPVLIILAILLLALFCVGLVQLFLIRFQGGEELPPYSTLRADPLGAKALYESLSSLPGIEVRRNYTAISGLEDGRGQTLFLLGTQRGQLNYVPEPTIQALDAFLISGGRLVIALLPHKAPDEPAPPKTPPIAKPEAKPEEKPEAEPSKTNAKEEPKPGDEDKKDAEKKDEKKDDPRAVRFASLAEHWGITIGDAPAPGKKPESRALARWAEPPLPPELPWRSDLIFERLDPAWRILYARSGRPVIADRQYGPGRLVVAADSYLFSNEGLRGARQSELLAWFVGPNASVLFDETHLGVAENPGIASLGRKYRLHGLLAGLALLAILFIWKNAAPLTPPLADQAASNGLYASGRDYTEGLIGLLRRNIPSSQLLGVCLKEWTASIRTRPDMPSAAAKKAEAALTGGKRRDPIQDYRLVRRIVEEERKPWPHSPNT